MSVYNTLTTQAVCPHCGVESTVEAEFRFGLRELIHYQLGDRLTWEGRGVRTPNRRPEGGNYVGEAYTECPNCGESFYVLIHVESDILVRTETDWDREDYGERPGGAPVGT